ncbi:NUDIX domain-containing protein [uncultured Devosia sp.]|uniref:NUDIX domain-containing protein n=1 Tax=uncultured Devosia sp. TaxID=211434 RepID=UPI0035CBFBCA
MSSSPNAASVALVREQQVLLIKRAYAPYQHLWTLPGGRIEAGETITECAAREIKEELGLTVYGLRPVLEQWLGQDKTFRLAVFATEGFDGAIVPSDEIADHGWLDRSQILGLRTTAGLGDVLEAAFALFERS